MQVALVRGVAHDDGGDPLVIEERHRQRLGEGAFHGDDVLRREADLQACLQRRRNRRDAGVHAGEIVGLGHGEDWITPDAQEHVALLPLYGGDEGLMGSDPFYRVPPGVLDVFEVDTLIGDVQRVAALANVVAGQHGIGVGGVHHPVGIGFPDEGQHLRAAQAAHMAHRTQGQLGAGVFRHHAENDLASAAAQCLRHIAGFLGAAEDQNSFHTFTSWFFRCKKAQHRLRRRYGRIMVLPL